MAALLNLSCFNRLCKTWLVLLYISGHGHTFLLSELCRLAVINVQSASQRTQDCYRDYFYQNYHRQFIKIIKFS